MSGTDELSLMVHVTADEWAETARRLRFLEALVIRIARTNSLMCEWYDAGEYAGLGLPGLPRTRAGIARRAAVRGWRSRLERKGSRSRRVYHISSLPNGAFDCLIGRILDLPADIETARDMGEIDHSTPNPGSIPENTAPLWVLPLMRLMKGSAKGHLGTAWAELPKYLPEGEALPPIEEAAETLVRLGLV